MTTDREHERREAYEEQRGPILQALTNYCTEHLRTRHGWQDDRGYTCDELGCMICNGGTAAETAERWLSDFEEPYIDDDGHQYPQPWMPFDLDDPEQVAEWLEDDDE